MKVGVVGASGYVGGELLRLLVSHPKVEISMVVSRQKAGQYVHRVHPSLKGFIDLTFSPMDTEKLANNCDMVFTSVPHGKSNEIVRGEELQSFGVNAGAAVRGSLGGSE